MSVRTDQQALPALRRPAAAAPKRPLAAWRRSAGTQGHRPVATGRRKVSARPAGAMFRPQRGHSLTELMVALAAAGLLLGIAVPEFRDLIAAQRATARINAVAGAIQTARHLAIAHNAVTVMCPGQGPACAGRDQWHLGTLIFADRDGDRRVDEGEFAAARLPKMDAGESLVWRSFRNRTFLRFRGAGLTDWQNGHFQYCPANGDPRLARQLILNAQGRVRQARDRDGDGIREDARGRPLRCD